MNRDTPLASAVDDAMAQIEILELPYLEALSKRLTQHIEERRVREYRDAKAEILRIAASVGMTVEELATTRPGPKTGQTYPVKYRHPSGKTWTGQGRMPHWMRAVDPEQYRV